MALLRIHAKPYDGDYELDLEEQPLTTLEWRWIKQLSGYLPATIGDGVRGGDPDVQLALGVIALVRAGRVSEQNVREVADRLAHAAVDSIEELPDPSEVIGEDPPQTTQASDWPTRNGGESGSSTSGHQVPDRSPTGAPGLPRSVTSDRLTSAG